MKIVKQPIDDPTQFAELCDSIQTSSVIGIDTEFTRVKTYNSIPQILQIATDDLIVCVDVAKCSDISDLARQLRTYRHDVVIHSAFQDLEVLHLLNALPKRIFDTQVAAQMCGCENMSYHNLVNQILGVHLDNAMTRSDWEQRPLSAVQIDYALDDVRYLLSMYWKLVEQIRELERTEWMEEEKILLKDRFTESLKSNNAWISFGHANNLPLPDQHRVRDLLLWRERRAQKANRPRRWIMKDHHVIQIVTKKPKTRNEIAKIMGIRSLKNKDWMDAVLRIANSDVDPEVTEPVWKPTTRLTNVEKKLVEELHSQVCNLAQQQGISAQLLYSKSDCRQIVRGNNIHDKFSGWRHDITKEIIAELPIGFRTFDR